MIVKMLYYSFIAVDNLTQNLVKIFFSGIGHGLTVSSAYQPSAKGNNKDVVLMQDGANPPKSGLKHYICRERIFDLAQERLQEKPDLETRESLLEKK